VSRLTNLLQDWVSLNAAGDSEVNREALAAALQRACEPLSDEMLRSLPGSPDDAATALVSSALSQRFEGVYLPFDWLESFCTALRLPLAELDNGWDISDGEDVYFCPSALLADDPDSPDDTRPFVRVDQIRRWPDR
jgi:hypothetical protein